MTSGSPGPKPNPGINRLGRRLPMGCLEPPTSAVHTQGTHMFSFISFHAKKYRVAGVCGGEQGSSRCLPGCPKRGRVAALSHCAHAAGSDPRQGSGPQGPCPSFSGMWCGGVVREPALKVLPSHRLSCPVLLSTRGNTSGTSRLCSWNHQKALRLLLPGRKTDQLSPSLLQRLHLFQAEA